MVSPQLATSMRMALPPQLAHILGDLASNVSEFSELAPGIPVSMEIYEDMFHYLKRQNICTDEPNTTGFYVQANILRTVKKRVTTSLIAQVECYSGVKDRGHPSVPDYRYELGTTVASEEFPFTVAGTRAAMDFLTEESNRAKRRGFCSDCLAHTPPRKRLRIAGTSVCAKCVLTKACS